ncbi:MAG: ComF family protein, partial [Micromonosporaceae bacterium]
MFTALLDLVLPATCPGCRQAPAAALCPGCTTQLRTASPRQVRPDPPPEGLPPCYGIGGYHGLLREVILGYKERGRYGLAAELGDRLAAVVSAAVPGRRPVVLIPVPATSRAARQRRGDHMLRLARRAAGWHRSRGRPAYVLRAVRADPRPDSAGLTAAQRLAVAGTALRPRTGILAA